MANRDNHYEAAFEAFLRSFRIPYVAIDEARRALAGDGSLKSLDFIVSPVGSQRWLVDVKGRKFPGGEDHQTYWKNWTPREDLDSLQCWEQLFGDGFSGLLVFAYWLVADRTPVSPEHVFEFRDRRYGFVAIGLDDYRRSARTISGRWDTVAMPTAKFRELAIPVQHLLLTMPAAATEATRG